jgi:hypothetical protein
MRELISREYQDNTRWKRAPSNYFQHSLAFETTRNHHGQRYLRTLWPWRYRMRNLLHRRAIAGARTSWNPWRWIQLVLLSCIFSCSQCAAAGAVHEGFAKWQRGLYRRLHVGYHETNRSAFASVADLKSEKRG